MMWTFGWVVTEANNITSATITKHIIDLTFANIRPLSFFSWTQSIQISICMEHQKCKISGISVYTPFIQPDQTSWCSFRGEKVNCNLSSSFRGTSFVPDSIFRRPLSTEPMLIIDMVEIVGNISCVATFLCKLSH